MYKILQDRSDLAVEFRDNPFGPYSAELQTVLNLMWGESTGGKRILVCLVPGSKWCLGTLNQDFLKPIEVDQSRTFDNLAAGYWDIFRHRWKNQTGSFPDVGEAENP